MGMIEVHKKETVLTDRNLLPSPEKKKLKKQKKKIWGAIATLYV